MKLSLVKIKDWMISLHMYVEQEGPFLTHLSLFYEGLSKHEKKYWILLVEALKSGQSFDQSVETIKQWMHPELYPMFVLLGNTLYPSQVTTMILSRIERIETLVSIKKKVLKYPQILSIMMTTLVVMYLLVMVPMYETMFSSYQYESSSLMKQLIAISAWIRYKPHLALILVMGVIIFFIGVRYVIRKFLSSLQFYIIGLKDIAHLKVYADVTYMLSIWLQTNMTLTEAIEHTITLSSHYMKEGLKEGLQALLEGAPFKTFVDFLPNHPHDMSSIVSHVQEDRQLIHVLQLLSKRYLFQYERLLTQRYQLMTPLLFTIIGAMILWMFYMVYQPILNMYDLLSGY